MWEPAREPAVSELLLSEGRVNTGANRLETWAVRHTVFMTLLKTERGKNGFLTNGVDKSMKGVCMCIRDSVSPLMEGNSDGMDGIEAGKHTRSMAEKGLKDWAAMFVHAERERTIDLLTFPTNVHCPHTEQISSFTGATACLL